MISVDLVIGYAVAPLSLIVCGALAGSGTGPMFAVSAVVLAVTGIGILSSRTVREMR